MCSNDLYYQNPLVVLKGIVGAKKVRMDETNCRMFSWLLEHAARDMESHGRLNLAGYLRDRATEWRLAAHERSIASEERAA
jgi:hypothetical protein